MAAASSGRLHASAVSGIGFALSSASRAPGRRPAYPSSAAALASRPCAHPAKAASTSVFKRHSSGWAAAVKAASSVVSGQVSSSSSSFGAIDPLKLVGKELSSLRDNVRSLLGSGHPSLDTIAKYYFHAEGKQIRPLIVLLISQAINGISPQWQEVLRSGSRAVDDGYAMGRSGTGDEWGGGVDESLSPADVLNDYNPHDEERRRLRLSAADSSSSSSSLLNSQTPILPTQRRLAEITEMIHVASLLHDDVIDASEQRRGQPSAPAAFGNKLSILGGDFLLGRASVALSRLGSNEVVELLATVIANLVEGEVMQLKASANPKPNRSSFATFWNGTREAGSEGANRSGPTREIFEHYMQKTYLKTASLIGKSARAAAILGGCGLRQGWEDGEKVKDAAYGYGRNLGIAFQLVDDLLDFSVTSTSFGKPSQGADLRLGLATAPALYAWEEYPEMGEMISRKFSGEGDVERARDLVSRSTGLSRTAELASQHASFAREALQILPESEARVALEQLTDKVLNRVR